MRVTGRSTHNLQVELTNHRHDWLADEPADAGGDDSGPNPFDLLLSALAACKVMTAHLYARRKGWPLEKVEVSLDIREIKANECDDCLSQGNERVNIIDTQIQFDGDLTTDQIQRLAQISDRCPVHRTLSREIKIRTIVADVPSEPTKNILSG